VELGGISSRNYTFDTISLIIWSAAELAVTMVCIGIPVLRPLWRRIARGSAASTDRYYKHAQGTDGADGFQLNKVDTDGEGNSTKMGLRGTTTMTYCEHGHNESDESILGPEFRHGQGSTGRSPGGIHVTEDVRIEVQTRSH
jgi:hypothetical protein